MKSNVPLLAIPALAVLALAGCNQNAPTSSTVAPSTNFSVSDTNGAIGAITNMPATNSPPDMNKNSPAGTNQ